MLSLRTPSRRPGARLAARALLAALVVSLLPAPAQASRAALPHPLEADVLTEPSAPVAVEAGEGLYFGITWDFENHLIRTDLADGTAVEHVYDADGNRVRTTTTPAGGTPEVTDYLVDTSGSLSHAVAETDATGNLVAYYVRGDDLLVVLRPDGSDAFTPRYYHADGLGSIRRLTDAAGNITDGYSYSAFGELLSHTGTDPQSYAFTGEPLDPNTGWQYHRARWMDPNTGRFASVDPFAGGDEDPRTLHKYLYAVNYTTNLTDPSGKVSFWLLRALVGARVHHDIGQHYRLRTGRQSFANYTPIADILGVDSSTCVPWPAVCNQKPDLGDPLTGEVYEIKPRRSLQPGQATLWWYLLILNANDRGLGVAGVRPWHEGITYRPPTYIFIAEYGGWHIEIDPPVDGIITYVARSQTERTVDLFALALVAIRYGARLGTVVGAQVGVASMSRF